jgi:hypothetical protein
MRRRMLLAKKPAPVENYLRVQPVAPQWITVGEPVVYGIESNVEWIIR